ncbi:hypothetical protein MMC14_009513 [Varicellaria rhodocarpa]|nr:hypothetical protein [Varicellaria rhodocarpa]
MTVELVEFADTSCYTTSKEEAQFIYKEIFQDHCYDIPNLSETPFIVDAGANIGLFSLYMKQKYPSSKILAFEPAPETFDLLRRNLTLHNLSADDVEALPFGLASKASTQKLTYFPHLPGNSTLVPEEKQLLFEELAKRYGREVADQLYGGAQEVDVQLQRLSHFLNSSSSSGDGGVARRIDLLKIDVEGAELDVLHGLDDGHWAAVRNVILETMEASGARVRIEELLRAKGFSVTRERASWAPEDFYMIRAWRDDDTVPDAT